MILKELILTLQNADQDRIVPLGFHHPHSYRGYYDQLAFEPKEGVAVREMLRDAKSACGEAIASSPNLEVIRVVLGNAGLRILRQLRWASIYIGGPTTLSGRIERFVPS